MDSGTSGGSMQSGSSGEDDQIDSSFSIAASSIPHLHQNHHLPPQTQLHHQPFFSSQNLHYPPQLTNNMSPYQPSNSFLESLPQSDLDRIWSMTMNNAHPQSQQQNQQHQQMNIFYSATSSSSLPPSSNPPTTQDPQLKQFGRSSTSAEAAAQSSGKENGSTSTGRVVKKRTRASRKTPTTVLTTDTTNFRAMVQEFTGIPTPPFGPTSLFPAKKFDLFGGNHGLDPALGSLLYSLNKSTNPNPNPLFAAPQLNPFSRNNPNNNDPNPNPNPNLYQQQQQHSQQMTTMLPSSSINLYTNVVNQAQQQGQNQNPNLAFQSSTPPLRPPFPSKYSAAGSNSGHNIVEDRGENDNISGSG